jgi:hypothetical protein
MRTPLDVFDAARDLGSGKWSPRLRHGGARDFSLNRTKLKLTNNVHIALERSCRGIEPGV